MLPVWGWGPRIGEGHMDPIRAAAAAAIIRPRLAIPIHWGTFYPAGMKRLAPDPLDHRAKTSRSRWRSCTRCAGSWPGAGQFLDLPLPA